jgi:glycosyltransferase involved in cell wall biosynthesis
MNIPMSIDNFWLGFITAVSALAGFTLASYSIFVSRIEIAAADTICRRYLFKECTSQYSLAYILFALTMFVLPLALGLAALFPFQQVDESWRVATRIGETVFVSFIGFINWKQFSYGKMLIGYNSKLKAKRQELKEKDRSSRTWRDYLHFSLAGVMLLFSWAILLVNLWHLNRRLMKTGVWNLDFGLLDWLANAISAELGAALSLFVGLALVSWHFYLFDPTRLVFEITEETKKMLLLTHGNIEGSLERLSHIQAWLRPRVANAMGMLGDIGTQPNPEGEGAKNLLKRAEEYLAGRVSSLREPGKETLEDGKKYHYAWLNFCREQKVMTFGDVVWIMNGVDLYVKALSNFEQGLKEMPEQLTTLVDPVWRVAHPKRVVLDYEAGNGVTFKGVSVVTPTHGRRSLVAALLESLQAARAAAGVESEVIIVDSSEGEDAQLILEDCERFHASYIRHPANNVRQKRNVGIRTARFPIVLFMDSDCTASPDLLVEHARSHMNDVGGVIGVTRFVGDSSQTWRLIERTSVLDSFSCAERMETVPWGPTCNISYRKEILEEVGGFDESFPFRLGGDDVDLGLRVTDAKHPIRCNPKAVVEHTRETWSSLWLIGRRLFRWGRMHHHLMNKHPGRVLNDFPKTMGLLFVLGITMAAMSGVYRRPVLLLLPLLWLALDLLLEAAVLSRMTGERLRDYGTFLGARLLGLTFELGTLVEAGLRGSLRPLYKEIYYAPPAPQGTGRNRRVVQVWAGVLALVALLPFAAWLR